MDFEEQVRSVSAIIFDFNGTMSNDESVLEKSYSIALKGLNLEPLGEGEYEALLGLSDLDISQNLLANRHSSHSVEDLLEKLTEAYLTLSRGASLIGSYTVKLINELQSHGKQVGVVTGTFRKLLEPVLKENDLGSLLPYTVTIEDVSRGKPSPEGFIQGARILGAVPPDVLVFEDSGAGIKAARAAGMGTVAIGPNEKAKCFAEYSFASMEKAAQAALRAL
ncbi:HAD-IA family hydrolase [Corynebacterium macginleyi]|uniref:HAD family hydrolase n=1 Tax=Corynebacterium macginleyi TaxID=38290 RepID=UPI00190B6BDF|nr:HAD family phosphatase [Corynebacterium macginleyi]MBK4142036.1 HAD-IA family hydrolase [Corynebacterium macginleyi]